MDGNLNIVADICAQISFLSESEGGRAEPISGERRFGCPMKFPGAEGFFDGFLLLEKSQRIEPGSVHFVNIALLSPELLVGRIAEGDEVTLWQGRDIGHGRVVRVLNHSLVPDEPAWQRPGF